MRMTLKDIKWTYDHGNEGDKAQAVVNASELILGDMWAECGNAKQRDIATGKAVFDAMARADRRWRDWVDGTDLDPEKMTGYFREEEPETFEAWQRYRDDSLVTLSPKDRFILVALADGPLDWASLRKAIRPKSSYLAKPAKLTAQLATLTDHGLVSGDDSAWAITDAGRDALAAYPEEK